MITDTYTTALGGQRDYIGQQWKCDKCGSFAFRTKGENSPPGWKYVPSPCACGELVCACPDISEQFCPVCNPDTRGSTPDEEYRLDKGKSPVGLVPPEVIWALADILQYGAKKYSPRAWEEGGPWMRTYASALRHMLKWAEGEDIDPESNLPHIEHALCNIAFLVTYTRRRVGEDTRPTRREVCRALDVGISGCDCYWCRAARPETERYDTGMRLLAELWQNVGYHKAILNAKPEGTDLKIVEEGLAHNIRAAKERARLLAKDYRPEGGK